MTLDPKTNKVKIRPCEKDCRLIINGTAVTAQTELVMAIVVVDVVVIVAVVVVVDDDVVVVQFARKTADLS